MVGVQLFILGPLTVRLQCFFLDALMSVKLIPCYLLIPGYYQYCWERIKKVALSRQPIVMLFGECKCLDSLVMPNCENVTQFETRFLAPEAPGTYTIMVSYIFS